MRTNNDDTIASYLEDVIDKRSLAEVLEILASVCHDKAEHCSHSWQDEPMARRWEHAAKELSKAAKRVPI